LKIQAELVAQNLTDIKQVIFDQNNAFVDDAGDTTNALENMVETLDDPDYAPITGAYGVHSYPFRTYGSRRGIRSDDLVGYEAVLARFNTLVDATKRSARAAPFVVGEFGAGKARFPQEFENNNRYIAELYGLFIAESCIAMMAAGVDGMCLWTLTDLYYDAEFRHGLFNGASKDDLHARPVYYIYGQLTRWCRGPNSVVFPTLFTDKFIRAIGMRTAGGEYRFIAVNRYKTARDVKFVIEGATPTFAARVYIYQVGKVPYEHQNIHNDLPQPNFLLAFEQGVGQMTLPPESVVLIAQDTHYTRPLTPPQPARTVSGNGIRLANINAGGAYDTSDIAYFRIYRGRTTDFVQYDPDEEAYVGAIAGDVNEFLDINLPPTPLADNEFITYKVQAVDRWGNESLLSPAPNITGINTESSLLNPDFLKTPAGAPESWVTVSGGFEVVPGHNAFNDVAQYLRNTGNSSTLQQTEHVDYLQRIEVSCEVERVVDWTGTAPTIWASFQTDGRNTGAFVVAGTATISNDVGPRRYKFEFTAPTFGEGSSCNVRFGITIPDGVFKFSRWDIRQLFITNPDFETTTNDLPTSWTTADNSHFILTVGGDSPVAGLKSFRNEASVNERTIEQTLTLTKNTKYRVVCHARRLTAWGSAKARSNFWAQLFISGEWREVGSAALVNVAGAHRYSFEFETLHDGVNTNGTINAKIGYTNLNNGTYAFTQWDIIRVDPGHLYDATTVNRNHLVDGAFKRSLGGQGLYLINSGGKSFTTMSKYNEQPWYWNPDCNYEVGPFSYSNETWYVPDACLKLTGASTYTICRQIVPYIRTNTRYKLSFWVLSADGNSGTRIGIQNAYNNWVVSKFVTGTNVWTEHVLFFKHGAEGSSDVNINSISVAIEDTGDGVIYFDNFDLRRARIHSPGPF